MAKLGSKELDQERLEYACGLIRGACNKSNAPLDNLQMAIKIMEFGGITLEDMRDYLEAKI